MLTTAEAAQRLASAGPNQLEVKLERPAWVLLASQFNSAVIWLLLVACLVSALVGEIIDAVRAAIASNWSNGQTEGQITKLKLVRRQMYGRAKLDLLEARLIAAAT